MEDVWFEKNTTNHLMVNALSYIDIEQNFRRRRIHLQKDEPEQRRWLRKQRQRRLEPCSVQSLRVDLQPRPLWTPQRRWGSSHPQYSGQVSIFPTLYEQLFCNKLFCAAFLLLQFGFEMFWQNNIRATTSCKMLDKLTTVEMSTKWNVARVEMSSTKRVEKSTLTPSRF